MSVDRVYVVFGARVHLGFFLLFVKNGFAVGARTLNVSASHLLMARPRHCLNATSSLHNSQCGSPTLYTHTGQCLS